MNQAVETTTQYGNFTIYLKGDYTVEDLHRILADLQAKQLQYDEAAKRAMSKPA